MTQQHVRYDKHADDRHRRGEHFVKIIVRVRLHAGFNSGLKDWFPHRFHLVRYRSLTLVGRTGGIPANGDPMVQDWQAILYDQRIGHI